MAGRGCEGIKKYKEKDSREKYWNGRRDGNIKGINDSQGEIVKGRKRNCERSVDRR